jgi:uncharacterized protein (TIGR00251 family)
LTEPAPDLEIRPLAGGSGSRGVSFWIHVTPRAARERVGGVHGGALRVAVREPPAEGAANAACVRALAGALGIGRSAIELDPGAKARRKRVRVEGDPRALREGLERLARMAGPRAVG